MTFTFFDEVYIDAVNVKAQTSINDLKNISDDIIKSFIIKAQLIIDNFIWDVEKQDENQDFKFPSKNSAPDIPTNVTTATLYLVENIYLDCLKQTWKEISQESWDWYSHWFKEWNDLLNIELLTGNIRNLLSEYWVNENNLDLKAFSLNY